MSIKGGVGGGGPTLDGKFHFKFPFCVLEPLPDRWNIYIVAIATHLNIQIDISISCGNARKTSCNHINLKAGVLRSQVRIQHSKKLLILGNLILYTNAMHTPIEQFTHTKSTTAQITKTYFAKARYFSYVCRYMVYARTLAHP